MIVKIYRDADHDYTISKSAVPGKSEIWVVNLNPFDIKIGSTIVPGLEDNADQHITELAILPVVAMSDSIPVVFTKKFGLLKTLLLNLCESSDYIILPDGMYGVVPFFNFPKNILTKFIALAWSIPELNRDELERSNHCGVTSFKHFNWE